MELDEKIIEEVRKHQLLYDLGMEHYKNVRLRDRAWMEVAQSVNLDEAQCKNRWKGLRDCYKRCKRAEVLASGSAAAAPRKLWKYYAAMSFLDKVTSARRTVSSIPADNAFDVDAVQHSSPQNAEEGELDCTLNDTVSTEGPSTSKRRRKEKDDMQFSDFLDTARASIQETCAAFRERTAARKDAEEDPTALLFAALAQQIKTCNMPPPTLNRLHQKVAALVYDEIEEFHQH